MIKRPPNFLVTTPRVPVSARDRAAQPGGAHHGHDHHRRRDPRGRSRQAWVASGGHARTPRAAVRPAVRCASVCRRRSDPSRPSRDCWSVPARRGATLTAARAARSSTSAIAARSMSLSSCRRVSSRQWRRASSSARCSTPSQRMFARTGPPSSSSTRGAWRNVSRICSPNVSAMTRWRRTTAASPGIGVSASNPSSAQVSCARWWPPHRSSWASISGRSRWSARSPRRAASRPSCSASAAPVTAAVARRKGGCIR